MPKPMMKVSKALDAVIDKINEIDRTGMSDLRERLDLIRLQDKLVKLLTYEVDSVLLSDDEQEMIFY